MRGSLEGFLVLPTLLFLVTGAKIYPVVEEQSVGTFVADVREQLPSNLTNRPDLKFGFLRGFDKKGFFHINDTSGQITTSIKLDRETLCSRDEINCYFDIPVITLPLHQFQIVPIKVELLDINDNAPMFAQRELVLEILESQPVGAKFQIPSAVDLDQGKSAQIEYSLKSPSVGKEMPFVIISTLNAETQDVFLQLTAPLDRESKDFYSFSVLAKDQGVPALVGSIDVVIQVLDANDNAPVFDDPSYEVRVQENVPRGTRILKVHASDADMGRNSEIAYSISSSTAKLVRDIFDIDSETGELHLKSELDREVKDVHKIWITARDKAVSSNMESTVLATVLVDDLNDNPPLIDISYFPQEASAAFIAEDAPIGTFVALVRLKDADTGINARAVCSLQSDTFALKQQSEDTYAIITSKLLDRERREEYLLELTAKDQGKPSLESRTTLQIVVGDVNDSPPVFDRSTYHIKVKENAKIGMEMISLRVTDKDSAPENQAVQYRLLEPSALFNIDEKQGILSVQSQLDRETLGDVIQFSVEAFDPEKPSLFKSQVPVIVELIDENDNSPEWSTGVYEFEINTDIKKGVVVGTVQATDVDFGNNGIVSYYSNNSLFIINRTSGELITAQDITVNEPQQIQLTLLASDNGEKPRTSSAQLFITIANATVNHLPASQNVFASFFSSSLGLPVIIALIVMTAVLFAGAIAFVVLYRNKSKENHSYNVRMETARVFQRGSKSQLAGEGSGTQSETDSCHRRSVESDEKFGIGGWVFPNAQTPPVSSSTKSSRCSSANTNRNSLLNDYGKVNGPVIYDVVKEESTSPPGKTIQTFQLASQLQKTLDGDAEAGAISDEDDDGGFKRHSVVRASSFYQSPRHPLNVSTRSTSSTNGTISPRFANSLPRRESLRGASVISPGKQGVKPPPFPESGYSSNSSFMVATIRPNPISYQHHNAENAPLSKVTKSYIDSLEVGPVIYSVTPPVNISGSIVSSVTSSKNSQEQDQMGSCSSPFSSSLNMSSTSCKSAMSSCGAGLEFDDFLPSPPIGTASLPATVCQVVEYQSLC